MMVGMPNFGVDVEGYSPRPDENMSLGLNVVSPGYFDSMRIPILQGRAFDERDTPDSPLVAIVSEPFARRFWPGQQPTAGSATFQMGFARRDRPGYRPCSGSSLPQHRCHFRTFFD